MKHQVHRLLIGCAASFVALFASCQRELEPAEVAERKLADARYPWQQPSWQQNQGDQEHAQAETWLPEGDGRVVVPDLGLHPALREQDTLDTALLPGDWLLVCWVNEEAIARREPNNFFHFRFASAGRLTLQPIVDGQMTGAVDGRWEKTGPGTMLMSIGNGAALTYYCEMFGQDFFYLWTFDTKNGLWLARRPRQASAVIEGDEFQFGSGERLKITAVRGQVYDGLIQGPTEIKVSGGYSEGVLNMRWHDVENKADGFAMFVVSPDWKSLSGVWWLNDFTAAPFGGSWSTDPPYSSYDSAEAAAPGLAPPGTGQTAPPPGSAA